MPFFVSFGCCPQFLKQSLIFLLLFLAKRTNTKAKLPLPSCSVLFTVLVTHLLFCRKNTFWMDPRNFFYWSRDLQIFWWYFIIILLVGGPSSSSYYCHSLFHILLCLELTNRILQSAMCILVLYVFLEDMTIKDIVGFVIFHFFTIFSPNYGTCFLLDPLLLPEEGSFHPSVQKFSHNWLVSFFWNFDIVLESQIWCVTELDF